MNYTNLFAGKIYSRCSSQSASGTQDLKVDRITKFKEACYTVTISSCVYNIVAFCCDIECVRIINFACSSTK